MMEEEDQTSKPSPEDQPKETSDPIPPSERAEPAAEQPAPKAEVEESTKPEQAAVTTSPHVEVKEEASPAKPPQEMVTVTEDGWNLYYSEEGYPYYYNASTGESQWADYNESDYQQQTSAGYSSTQDNRTGSSNNTRGSKSKTAGRQNQEDIGHYPYFPSKANVNTSFFLSNCSAPTN